MSVIVSLSRSFVAIALAGALAACGSGGGDSSPNPPVPSAQFGSPVFTALDDVPRLIVYGDFDGDGRKDAVLAFSTPGTSESARLVFLRGKADGSFEAARPVGDLAIIQSVEAVDVNRNGQLDLVALGCSTNPCPDSGSLPFVFLGNGAGAFSAPVGYATGLGSNVIALGVGDFNGDGAPDIAVGRVDVAILLGNGDGTFKPPTIWPAGNATVFSLSAADFTGDGKQDLLVVYSSLTKLATVLPGRGNGEFGAPMAATVLGSFATGAVLTDLNRDAKPDFLLHPPTGPLQFQMRLGKGDGTFADSVFVADDAGPLAEWNLGDLDRDGVPDLVTRDFTGNVAVLYGKGDGTFLPRQVLTFTLPATSSPSMHLADLNGDGRPDLVTWDGSTLAVRLNTR